MTEWADLNARARGLSTRLLGRAALEGLAHSPDLTALSEALERRGYLIDAAARGAPDAIELAARRVAASRLRTLRRWAGPRSPALAIVFEDEDRRSISILLRGTVQHAPADLKLAGLLPTPALPERALEQLAHQPAPGAVAALLAAWKHPLGAALVPESGKPEVDLLRLEAILARTFFARSLETARSQGTRSVLFSYVQRLLDLHNAGTILTLSAEQHPSLVEMWIEGGKDLPRALGQRAVTAGNPAAAGAIVASGFGKTGLARAFAAHSADPVALEAALLKALIGELKASARRAPLSPAVVLGYALRLRAELLDIRRTVWGIPLGAPPRLLAEGMVTPP